MINNILNIKNNNIRIFPFQTKDPDFILYNDLPLAYLLTLLIDNLGFKLNQFGVTYIYPTNKFILKIEKEILNYNEEYFIFYLENYFHSSDYAFGFIESICNLLQKNNIQKKIFIHTLKAPENDIIKLIKKYSFVKLVITGDIEEFFYDLFENKKDIQKISNIYYRDDNGKKFINQKNEITTDLNYYIKSAYSSGYYKYFPKVKEDIISIIDDDNKFTNEKIYYKRPRNKIIKNFRYDSELSIMLSSGRGCKYNCSYCFRGVKYYQIRQISLSSLKKDLDYLNKLSYEYIYFYDDCFITTNLNRLEEIIKLLNSYKFKYSLASRFEVCTEENLKKIAKLNIVKLQIGLQSISFTVNKGTKRGFVKSDFEQTLYLLKKYGIKVSLDIILGLPGEGLKGFLNTFKYAVKMKPTSIFINSLFLNPGTELYKNQKKYGIVSKQVQNQMFYVDSIGFSKDFPKTDIEIAKKYVLYYIEKIKDIYIVLR